MRQECFVALQISEFLAKYPRDPIINLIDQSIKYSAFVYSFIMIRCKDRRISRLDNDEI